jgi:hypothetical protein
MQLEFDADSSEEVDQLVTSLPHWGLVKINVKPLTSNRALLERARANGNLPGPCHADSSFTNRTHHHCHPGHRTVRVYRPAGTQVRAQRSCLQ